MIRCKFCGCAIDLESTKPVAVGSWLDAEKIYLCDEHIPWLNDTTEIELIDPFYRNDESWQGNVVPVGSIKVARMALMQAFIVLRGWLLVNPPYPRKTPIQNIMINLAQKLPNYQLLDLNLALLFVHWSAVENECEIDFEEFDFFNPCTAAIFDEMNMQDYQQCLTQFIHTILKAAP